MPWYAWIMVVIIALNSAATVYLIDKPRKSISRTDALLLMLFNGLFIWGIVSLAV